jgi:hypothetical protein
VADICEPAWIRSALGWKVADLRGSDWLDNDEATGAATIDELNASVDFREERIIAAAANVQAGLEWCSALPNDDRTAGDELTTERLYAEPLRV